MNPDLWQEAQRIFHDALTLEEELREAFVAREAHHEHALMEVVLRMLAADSTDQSALDRELVTFAADLFDDHGLWESGFEFGNYRVIRRLGEGGNGIVLLAERIDIGGQVAIKVLRDAWLSPARRDRFFTEERLLAHLRHPNIAQLHEAGVTSDGTPWFAMEYVDGQPLTEHVTDTASSTRERVDLLIAVAKAADYAHRQAVLHRDLKPSNILVDHEGTPRLLDFGVGKQLEADGAFGSESSTTLRMFTPAYAAPEQLEGRPAGVDTDVYSLGVILFEVLTGSHPFGPLNRSRQEIDQAVLHGTVKRPSSLAHDNSISRSDWADLDLICQMAMSRDRELRYPTAGALADDLGRFLAGKPIVARAPSMVYRSRKFLVRNRWRVGATTAVVLAAAGGWAKYTIGLSAATARAQHQANRAELLRQYTSNLISGGESDGGPPEDLKVVTLLDQSELDIEALTPDPELQADLLLTLADANHKLGRLGRADSLLARARKLIGGIPRGEDHIRERTALATAELRITEARLDDADSLLVLLLSPNGTESQLDPSLRTDALYLKGLMLEARNDNDSAVIVLDQALNSLPADTSDFIRRVSIMNELANSYFYRGDYEKSDSLNHLLLNLSRNRLGPRNPSIADNLINLGSTQSVLGNSSAAEGYFREGIKLIEDWYGPNHWRTASALTQLGREFTKQGRWAEADSILQRAELVQATVFGPDHPKVASPMSDRATVALNVGNLNEAANLYLKAHDIYSKAYGKDNSSAVTMIANLASVRYREGRLSEAEKLMRQALDSQLRTLGPTHLVVGINYSKLGRVLMRQRRYREAESNLLKAKEILDRQSPGSPFDSTTAVDLAAVRLALKK